MSATLYYNYVLFMKDFNTVNQTVEKLISLNIWHARGKFLLFTLSQDYLNKTIEYFWRLNIVNLILAVKDVCENSLKICTANRFDKSGQY